MVDSTNQNKENKPDKGDKKHLRNDPRGSGLHTQVNIYEHVCVHTHILEHTKGFTEQKVEQCCPLEWPGEHSPGHTPCRLNLSLGGMQEQALFESVPNDSKMKPSYSF